MITFLRKIRQSVLSENKFGKYVVYAIGEIILVVIGILIALQINTLEKQKENRRFELLTLNNIRNEIHEDIGLNEHLQNRCKQMEQAADLLLESYGSSNDSLVLNVYPIMTMGISFESRKGAYEALKSTGLDKISTDTIRNALTSMYDFGLPRVSRWLNESKSYKEGLVQRLEVELFAPTIRTDPEGNREIVRGLKEEEIESIGILGTATEGGWETDIDMVDENQNGIYTIEITLKEGEVKFRANDKWTINWGGALFPKGQGFRNGLNIIVKAGHYKIKFNTENEVYQFNKVDK